LTRGSQSYTRTRSPVATISGFVKSQIKFLVPQHEHETNDKQKHGLKNKILGQKNSPAVSEDLFFFWQALFGTISSEKIKIKIMQWIMDGW
jgi:hypothetical protein